MSKCCPYIVLFLSIVSCCSAQTWSSRLQDLEERLKSTDSEVRATAIGSVINGDYRDGAAAELADILLKCMGDNPVLVTDDFGLIINHLGRRLKLDARVALPLLIELAESVEVRPYLRSRAIQAVPHIEPDSTKVVDFLMDVGRDADANINRSVSSALGTLGASAKPAVPMLLDYLLHEHVALDAFKALGEIERSRDSLSLQESIQIFRGESALSVSQTSAILLKLIELDKAEKVGLDSKDISTIRAELVRLIGKDQPDYVRALAVNALYNVGPTGDLDTVIALGDAMEQLSFYLAKPTFTTAVREGNSEVLPFLEERFLQYRPKENYPIWECYVNALAQQGKRAQHLAPLIFEDILLIENWAKSVFPSDHEVAARSSGIWNLIGTGIYCLASLGYDDSVTYELIIKYSNSSPKLILGSASNRDYSIRALAHLPLPIDLDQRARVLDRMNQALEPETSCYDAVYSALLGTVDSMTDKEVDSLLIHLSRILHRLYEFDLAEMDSPIWRHSEGVFEVIQQLGERANELYPIVNQIALEEVREPGFDFRIFRKNSVIEAAIETVAVLRIDNSPGRPLK